jgi:hypothetical protein
MSEIVPSTGAYAYGGYPDIDALYKEQAGDRSPQARGAAASDPAARPRAREIRAYLGIHLAQRGGVAEPALMLIDPYPWSAALEEVRLKKN